MIGRLSKDAVKEALDSLARNKQNSWSYQKKGLQTRREGNVTIYGIPYSEHSSFAELRDCVKRLRPKRIIPTVNCPDAASARAIVDRFADLMDLSRDKSRLDSYFGRTASAPAVAAGDDSQAEFRTDKSQSRLHAQCIHHDGANAIKTEEPVSSAVSAAQTSDDKQTPGSPDRQASSAAGVMDPGQVKCEAQEEEGGSSIAWEDTAVDWPTFDAEGLQQCADEDEEHEQTLAMRSRPVPEHAHSAPAVLTPPSKVTHPPPDPSSPHSAGHPRVKDGSVPMPLDMSRHCTTAEADGCASVNAQSSVGMRPQLHGAACATDEAAAKSLAREASLSFGQCGRLGSVILDEHVAELQPCVSLLDDVDIAEQSRILCAIQQHQLYTKRCLTSKKRQLTLGGFVAPKRLK